MYKVPLARGEWHEQAKALWQAIRKSDQTAFYQPSDWQYAHLQMEWISRQLESDKPSAMMLAMVDSVLSRLLVTEGDRRRVRIELGRGKDSSEEKERQAGVSSLKAYRAKLGGGS